MAAIPSSDVSFQDHIIAQLWGSLWQDVREETLNSIALTINDAGEHKVSDCYGLSATLSRTASIVYGSGVYGGKTITITANCAWRATYAGSTHFSITGRAGNFTFAYNPPGQVTFGGNGTVTITRDVAAGAFTGTVTITFSNNAGGTTTLTVPISSTG